MRDGYLSGHGALPDLTDERIDQVLALLEGPAAGPGRPGPAVAASPPPEGADTE
ncbi:hypothetical protein LO762_13395 [Actinocorallia sp. API 0066]|uniref:hypothetical protein n=1 Tax=Actinocorallia sp. API 0066 TaxID=2896846 RepID=UPI001E58E802|nr:hypothetical protein [Actinocorallia sp. API 0066]MCD0450180.1 hypothetical protein [Actinocorallia sp. API 0066]